MIYDKWHFLGEFLKNRNKYIWTLGTWVYLSFKFINLAFMRQFLFVILLLFPLLIFGQSENRELIIEGIERFLEKEHGQSLELLAQAKTRAEENNNHEELFLIYNNIGLNYYTMLDYGEALKNYQKAYEIAINKLGPTQESTVINNIAILYSQEKKYTKAEEYFSKAYTIAKKKQRKTEDRSVCH